MKNIIYITGRDEATLVLKGKVRRDDIELSILPLIGNKKSGKTCKKSDYDKKNPLVTIKFENVRAITNVITALNMIRDAALRIESYQLGVIDGFVKGVFNDSDIFDDD